LHIPQVGILEEMVEMVDATVVLEC